jgi:hypothetical protein
MYFRMVEKGINAKHLTCDLASNHQQIFAANITVVDESAVGRFGCAATVFIARAD